jgi:hypothetical protein
MKTYAFKDAADGYYQVEVEDGASLPDWTKTLISCELMPSPELTYAQKRAMEYPPMTDYFDGVVKGDQAQIDKYIADCLAVKAKYPKV